MGFISKVGFAGLLASAAVGAQAETTVLTVASFKDLDRSVLAAIPLYKKVRPDVEIKLVSLGYGDHHNAMTTALATGANLPDVMGIEIGFVAKMAEGGGVEDLSKPPYDAGALRPKFFPFASAQATSRGGIFAAVPADIGPGALFYRKDLMDKAGITEAQLTKSWDSYIDAGKTLKAKTGAYLVPNAATIKDIILRSGLKNGEGIYFDDKGKVLVDSPRFVRAFETAKLARAAGIDAKVGAWSNEWSEGFKRGTVASEMMGAWLAGHLKNWIAPETAGQWRAAGLPGGVSASWGGSFYAIPKGAKNKPAAWDFIKFMTTNKEVQLAAFRELDAFPALIDATNDAFVDQPMPFLGGQAARKQWKVAASAIPATAVDRYDPIAAEVVAAEFDKVLEQDKAVPQALADAKKAIERRVRR
ncbi:extracellular solute-binding protein [Rhizobacter sp. Root1221]|uniref:extracellular solute-binding protein n=1 Tax=Rhizobacter sp. Root1221 TaxID=1736433 RepID=UPI0006F70944|nr:extracellular solute-binding protein [Rhizobacter sp. Root1221]KQV95211.1 sugar ABC transporter substrate-binding protein [Rhizobacter sp. Root1221]